VLKKKILLVFASSPLSVTAQIVHTPPLGIGYIASFLLREGHTVKIVDLQVQQESLIFKDLDFDIIGVSSITPNFSKACELIKAIKERGFRGRVVIGGSHATALPEQALRLSGADLVCIGEGEAAMTKLANDVPLGDICSLGWIENGNFKPGQADTITESLDNYPFPAFQLFDLARYGSFHMVMVPAGTKDGIIITSRGCPFSCDFCSKISPTIRFRSPENIVSEIRQMKQQFGYKRFSFIDDCFNANPKRAKEICRRIIQEKLEIAFSLPSGVRADLLDEELVGLMKESGCTAANIGVESWDDAVRSSMNKKLNREAAITAVQLLRKHGIVCTAYFIMGHYYDTLESLQRNIDAVKELGADFFQFAKFVPMPGSRIYKRITEEGRIRDVDFSKFSIFGDASVMEHPRLSNDDIDAAIKRAYRKAAFRLRTIRIIIQHPIIGWNVMRNIGQVAGMIKFKSNIRRAAIRS
jgi:anaerobic magnesium-protoporphyrin IX monomethyl ester cyclase